MPSLLLVQLFRRIRQRVSDEEKIKAVYDQLQQIRGSALAPKSAVAKKSGRPWMFPWWCIFVAYALSLIIVGISSLFIIARGIEFGDEKTQKWLVSLVIGFLSSILLTQPIKDRDNQQFEHDQIDIA